MRNIFLILSLTMIAACSGRPEEKAALTLASINKQVTASVAADDVNQYNFAKRLGEAKNMCHMAGRLKTLYFGATDESNYQQWKKVEAADCKRAWPQWSGK